MSYIAYALFIIGGFFYFVGGLGIYRMPDFYNRAQAGTKATTLGTFSLLLGVGIMNPSWLPKILLIITFIAITNPVGASALTRSAYVSGVKAHESTKVDELSGLYKEGDE